MKESVYKTYKELPLFLNAETVAQTGVPTSAGPATKRLARRHR